MKSCLKCHDIFRSDEWACPRCGWVPASIKGITSLVVETEHIDKGFESGNFPLLYAIEKEHFWFKSRNRIIIWAFKRFFPKAASFLEIGCGTGFVLRAIKKALPFLKLTGGDLYYEGLEFAKKRVPHATLLQMDAETILFVHEFDVIGAFDVLEHISGDENVLREFHTALKKDGGIILTVPQHPILWSDFDRTSCHQRRYTRKEIIAKLSKAGFRTVFISSFVSLLMPFMVAVRWKGNSGSNKTNKIGSGKIPVVLNFLFELVMVVELMILRCGVSLPFGGSLLVVAKKQ